MSVVSVYAIFANAEEAERIGRIAVEERLAACINILAQFARSTAGRARSRRPTRSPRSSRLRPRRADALITRIAALHSYEFHASSPGRSTRLRQLRRLGRGQRGHCSAAHHPPAWHPLPSGTAPRRACAAGPRSSRRSCRRRAHSCASISASSGVMVAEIGDRQPPAEDFVAADLQLGLMIRRQIVADRLEIADEIVERGIFADVDEILDASRHWRRSPAEWVARRGAVARLGPLAAQATRNRRRICIPRGGLRRRGVQVRSSGRRSKARARRRRSRR